MAAKNLTETETPVIDAAGTVIVKDAIVGKIETMGRNAHQYEVAGFVRSDSADQGFYIRLRKVGSKTVGGLYYEGRDLVVFTD